ncbi:SDR family oxidoreductase [Candidatus Nomurabacteria bacterium]|nr:SDR family oxidoreductase [Candidatus Nomurabacteria bacterium]
MANSKRILILGGSGMLGHKLWQRLRQHFPQTCTTLRGPYSNYAKLKFFDSPQVLYDTDLLTQNALETVLNRANPEVILNCVGITKRHIYNQTNPYSVAQAIRLNAELPHRISAWAKHKQARVIQFSTDCVFDGTKGNYKENDPCTALDIYGLSKTLGELNAEHCLTIRSSFIGHELFHKTELLEWFLQQRGKSIQGFTQAIYSGLAVWVLADLVVDLIEKFQDLNGLYHVSSQPINKYELLCQMQEIFDINAIINKDDTVVCKRDLDGSKFSKITGFQAPSWPEMLKGIAKDI